MAESPRDEFPNHFVGDLAPKDRGWVVVPPTCCPGGHDYSDRGWSVSAVWCTCNGRRLSVHDNAVQLGVDHAVGRTKSRTERSVPVPQFVLDQLAVQCEGRGRDDLVFGEDGATYLPRSKSLDGWFAGAVKRAKVQKITPHDLRHTCASIAISSRR